MAVSALLLAAAVTATAQEGSLRTLLPEDGAVTGWTRDGDPQDFVGEDLYAYIDGGAEIYQEYGFRRIVVQDFRGPAGKSVSLEIFEMAGPAAAFGMFSLKRSGRGRAVGLGSAAELEDYYLNLWRGRFLVTLTGFDATAATIEGLLAVAGAVAGNLGDEAAVPDLVAALPAEGLRPQSVKYLKGLLGLNNVYPFFTARGLSFAEAVSGEYGDGRLLLVMEHGSVTARSAAWADLGAFLRAGGRFTGSDAGDPDVPVFVDGKGRFAAFGQAGSRLFVAVGPAPDAALGLVRLALGSSPGRPRPRTY